MGMLKEGAGDKLVMLASGGNSLAKNTLMVRYQPFVLRLVKRMKAENPEDVAQDILVKVIVNLNQFENRSLFTTWVYRITINHVLQLRKKSKDIPLNEFPETNEPSGVVLHAERISKYMMGMVTCLQPEQRITMILSDHFKSDHNAAAQALMITPANFRKRLSRARKDMQHWMSNQCSLTGLGERRCQCTKKKKYFIDQGWVDPATQKFTTERLKSVRHVIDARYLPTSDHHASIT